ncbi:MAG: hypothetical protein WDN10_03475 [bacterium]
MIFSRTEDLEDRIIELLLEGRLSIKSMHARLVFPEKSLSLRAIYKATDKLIAAGVLIKTGKRLMVDEEWARRVGERLRPVPVAAPSVGEKFSHTFTSIEHLDAFWKTVVLPIEESVPNPEVFFYNPHDFWAYMPERKESEEAYYRHFAKVGRHGFFIVGGESEADKEFKREYQGEYLQIDTRNILSLRRSDHVTVIGSLIVTVRLPKVSATRIDKLYESNRPIKDTLPELLPICRALGKIRFTLENDPLKAKKLRKLLARNFYFPKT